MRICFICVYKRACARVCIVMGFARMIYGLSCSLLLLLLLPLQKVSVYRV